MLTRDDLIAICPRPKQAGTRQKVWDEYAEALTSRAGWELFQSYQVNTPKRLAMFMGAVVAPETGLTVLWESGAYDAGRIVAIFGPGRHSAKIGSAEAARIAALPGEARTRALFERAYGQGNPGKASKIGNTEPGDGWRFRGLGLNQMTGRAAHENAAAEIGCTLEDLAKPLNCLHMALIEWDEKDCNRYADAGDVVSVRKLINGGSLRVPASRINGMPEARRAYAVAMMVIGPEDFKSAPAGKDGAAIAIRSAPLSMARSTEGQAATGLGIAGGWQAETELSNAMAAMAASGQPFTLSGFALHLASSPGFWLAALTIAGAAYWFLKRRARLYLDGV